MSNLIDQDEQEKITDLLTKSSLSEEFTLSDLMVNLWVDSLGALIIFGIFFFCCRLYRKDKERFIQKLHKMTAADENSEDDDYDDNLQLIQLDTSLRASHINVQQMEGNSPNWLRVNVARMNPLSIIQIIDEPTMIHMFGRDRFLYLKFLKYQSWFFLTIFFLGWTILLPTYTTGNDADQFVNQEEKVQRRRMQDDPTNIAGDASNAKSDEENLADSEDVHLLVFTILNITSSPTKLLVAYIFTIVTTIVMYISIFCFWRGTHTWFDSHGRYNRDLNDMGYSQLHNHCLLLKGIPRHMAPSEAQRHIKRILNMVEGFDAEKQRADPHRHNNKIIYEVTVVEDFNEFFNLKQELQNLNRQMQLSHKYELMLKQLELYQKKTPEERRQFLKKLDQRPELTREPFYRMCPNYDANSHKREMEAFRQEIQISLKTGQHKGSQSREAVYRRTVTMAQSGNNLESRSPMKRISPDKRTKRSNGQMQDQPFSRAGQESVYNSVSRQEGGPGAEGREEDRQDPHEGGCCWSCWRCLCLKSCKKRTSKNRQLFIREIKQASRLAKYCCCGKMTPEAQRDFTKKLKAQNEQVYSDLARAKEHWIPKNIGYAFVFSEDKKVIEKFIKMSGKIRIDPKHHADMPETQRTKLQFGNWVFQKAFHWNDINWNELNPKPLISCRKSFILCLILVLLSLFLVTPLMVYKTAIGGGSIDDENESAFMRTFGQFIPLLVLVLVNIVIIPFFVDMAAMLMDNETKSSMQKKIMYMNMILMHINMLILPLAGLITYEQIIDFIKRETFENLLSEISQNVGTMASFIMKYLVQVIFITNCIQMLDVPHFAWKGFFTFLNWMRHRPYKDDWFFQLGYYQSFTFTIMSMSLIFSVAMPICTFFAFIFFLMRYQIEKYNFIFVYHQEFESVYLLQHIAKLQVVVCICFQLVNFTQIQTLMGDENLHSAFHYVLIALQVMFFLFLYFFKKYKPEKYDELEQRYLFFQSPREAQRNKGKDARLDDEMKKALAKAYQHPWWKLESQVKFIYEREEFKQKINTQRINKIKANVSKTESHRQLSDGDIYSERDSQRSSQDKNDIPDINKMIKQRVSTIMTPRENLSAMGPKELRTSKLFENAISPRKGSDAQRDRDSITKTHGPRVASKHQPPRRSNEHLINNRRCISPGKPSRPSVRISTDEFVVDKNALRNSLASYLKRPSDPVQRRTNNLNSSGMLSEEQQIEDFDKGSKMLHLAPKIMHSGSLQYSMVNEDLQKEVNQSHSVNRNTSGNFQHLGKSVQNNSHNLERADTMQQARGHQMSNEDLLRVDNPASGVGAEFFGAAMASENAPIEDENSRIMATSNALVQGDIDEDKIAAGDSLALEAQASATGSATNGFNLAIKHSKSAQMQSKLMSPMVNQLSDSESKVNEANQLPPINGQNQDIDPKKVSRNLDKLLLESQNQQQKESAAAAGNSTANSLISPFFMESSKQPLRVSARAGGPENRKDASSIQNLGNSADGVNKDK